MSALGTQYFDDGSTLITSGGVVIGGTDANGVAFLPAATSIVDQASALFNYGARAWLGARFAPAAAPASAPAPVQKTLGAQLAALVPIALVVGLGVLAYKALKS